MLRKFKLLGDMGLGKMGLSEMGGHWRVTMYGKHKQGTRYLSHCCSLHGTVLLSRR